MEYIIGILIGFVTFYLYPITEYLGKKYFTKNDGNPELWFLPDFGFRLVIRNIPNKVKLYDLKYKSKVRIEIPPSNGSSVITYNENKLNENNDFFLFPGDDHIILAFKLISENQSIFFVHTDKLGNEISKFNLNEIDLLISDYTAQIDNKFHFDVFVGRRVVIKKEELIQFQNKIKSNAVEQNFVLKDIKQIG